MTMSIRKSVEASFVLAALLSGNHFVSGFQPIAANQQIQTLGRNLPTKLAAAPKRLDENVDGPLYVNSQCINCSACAMFAPKVFERRANDGAHIVHHQPTTEEEIETSRAALAACPVAAIRVETQAHRQHRNMEDLTPDQIALTKELAIGNKTNGRTKPFPRVVSEAFDNLYFVGHHNKASFGAAPYLLKMQNGEWIMIDTPKFSKSAVETVESLTGPGGPKYLILTHVDDTAGHQDWSEHYPDLKRVFHSGDLGPHNWIGDKSLESVEILLNERSTADKLQYFGLDGKPLSESEVSDSEVVLIHTPGHSPGSISVWKRPSAADIPDGILLTGDTYSYTTRDGGHMSGFPRYGNDRRQQAKILQQLHSLDWHLIAPGHGHIRDYRSKPLTETAADVRSTDIQDAVSELQAW